MRVNCSLKEIWENSIIGIIICNNGKITKINPIASTLFGYETEELIGREINSFLMVENHDILNQITQDLLFSEENINLEFRILTKKGEEKWLLAKIINKREKEFSTNIFQFIDITKYKLIEKKLSESENLYRTIFETTGSATIIIEEDMTISLLNKEFENMTGYKKSDWEGKKKWTEYVAKKDLERMKKYHVLRRKDPSAVPRKYEHDLIDSNGKIRHVHLTVDMIPGTKKSVASFTDITEWKEAQRDLHIKSKRLEELNTALRVLLNDRDKVRKDLEENIVTNINNLILPYIEKARVQAEDKRVIVYLDIIESNLKDIFSPFYRRLSEKYLFLTPREKQIAKLIREGKTSKEIADILNTTKYNIDIYRYRLRKKFGLSDRKISLYSYLTNNI